ncbi:hypothetical protein rosmuc_01006 [Roseovarius mucosus DSM 17069]|uniref:Uncharacterized protein n=1 Tax=Roseovarius mucosus DSM 17069 TaxID=1288298 RepID=A0A0A0HSH6_9RHOB|nr:hypothetical protein [Roseovarius mucosus]KGM89038.1 hypothetical protein rosmuc_01006 [Roseovarius mucosus DSM 17069]
MALRLPLLILLTGLVAGCSDILPLDRTVDKRTRDASYPDLIPTEDIRAQATTPQITPDTADTLDQRSAGLRARAARLKRGVVDPGTQERMQSGVNE